jgi:choline-glycine betaine transporter
LIFTIVAIATALGVHRFGLPLTFRSRFYPIFDAYTWGWIGDAIDGIAIVVVILSVANMLCESTVQLTSGLVSLGWIDENSTEEEITSIQKIIMWLTTMVSITSVFSGLQGGIKYVSLTAVTVALVAGFLVFIMDDTKYILNLTVQAV